MTFLQAFFLGLLQGITEFLPISSSGHLVLAESLFKLDVDSLKDFDVMLHIGTLFAILIYFRREVFDTKRWPLLVAASVPAALVGILLEDPIDALFRNAHSVAIAMIVVGSLYFITPKKSGKPLTWWKGIAIGCAQAMAIIPGVSRSGSTIWTGTLLGLKREEAARFSFLLGAIAIAGAGLLKSKDVFFDESVIHLAPSVLAVGFVTAFLSSLGAVTWLMKFLQNHSLKAFGIYRVILGVAVLILLNNYVGEVQTQLTITPKVNETNTEQKEFPTGSFTFEEGSGSILGGAYTGLALSFDEETQGQTLGLNISLPSTEQLSFGEAWDNTNEGDWTWWVESEVPALPFTFDQGLFEGLYSDRLQGSVLPEFKLSMTVGAERTGLYFEDFEMTLDKLEITDGTKLTLEGNFFAENEGYRVEGELHLYKVPLGITDID